MKLEWLFKSLRWTFRFLKVATITLGTIWLGAKWVQNEFRAIAKDEIGHVESKLERLRSADMEHIDLRFDRVEKLIIERVK